MKAIEATETETASAKSPAPAERLLTLAEVRQAAGVSEVTVWRWTRESGLRVIRCGRFVRVREGDWLAWLAKHTSDGKGSGEAKGNAQ
jgi:predicted DNA-binding transcriptional regulator AlpA